MADTFGFSLNDAKRIGKAVRLVERDEPRLDLGGDKDATMSRGVRLMLARHAGSNWPASSSAVVTIYNGEPGSVASAVTVVAHNQFLSVSGDSTCQWVALGNNGYGWYAVAVQPDTATCTMYVAGFDMSSLPGYDGTKVQMLGHDTSECIRWYDITSCSTAS